MEVNQIVDRYETAQKNFDKYRQKLLQIKREIAEAKAVISGTEIRLNGLLSSLPSIEAKYNQYSADIEELKPLYGDAKDATQKRIRMAKKIQEMENNLRIMKEWNNLPD